MSSKPKSSDLSFVGISKSITHAESRRLPQLMDVLEYIRKNDVFSAKQLENSTTVSRDSIDRIIRILERKKLIILQERRLRGEKFYKIASTLQLQSYYLKLRRWWSAKFILKNNVQKGATKLKKTFDRNSKMAMYASRSISESDSKKQFQFVSKKGQLKITKIPYPNPVIIFNLPYSEGDKIVKNYRAGLFCETCFKENKISFLIPDLGVQVCELGHEEILPAIEFNPYSAPLERKRRKSISDSDLKMQTKSILRKTKKPKIEDE